LAKRVLQVIPQIKNGNNKRLILNLKVPSWQSRDAFTELTMKTKKHNNISIVWFQIWIALS